MKTDEKGWSMTASRILKLENFSVVLLPLFTEYCLLLGSLYLPKGIAVLARTRGVSK